MSSNLKGLRQRIQKEKIKKGQRVGLEGQGGRGQRSKACSVEPQLRLSPQSAPSCRPGQTPWTAASWITAEDHWVCDSSGLRLTVLGTLKALHQRKPPEICFCRDSIRPQEALWRRNGCRSQRGFPMLENNIVPTPGCGVYFYVTEHKDIVIPLKYSPSESSPVAKTTQLSTLFLTPLTALSHPKRRHQRVNGDIVGVNATSA